MNHRPAILATDLDGTLIPLGEHPGNEQDLAILARELRESKVPLVFVTGRHIASIERAIERQNLPQPDWVIANVGTMIFHRVPDGGFEEVTSYREHLDERISHFPINELDRRFETLPGLRRQQPEKQGRFKLSFYCEGAKLLDAQDWLNERLAKWQAPYCVVASIDPFDGGGLIDLLPAGVDKAYGLAWWSDHTGLEPDSIVFAGDSGNDLAALVAGYRVIVVSNAAPELAHAVRREHEARNWQDRLFLATQPATSGVLEGCRWFGLLGK